MSPKTTILRGLGMLLLPLAPMPAVLAQETGLPAEVAAAISAKDCERLLELNAAQRRLDEPPPAVLQALADAILELPRCGNARAELVSVEPIRGLDFFDPAALLDLNRNR